MIPQTLEHLSKLLNSQTPNKNSKNFFDSIIIRNFAALFEKSKKI